MGTPYSGNQDDQLKLAETMSSPSGLMAFIEQMMARGKKANDRLGGQRLRDSLIANAGGSGLGAFSDYMEGRPKLSGAPTSFKSPRGGSMGSPVARPQMRQARDYWRENYDHNFEREQRKKDMDLEQMYKDKELQNKLNIIMGSLRGRGMNGGNVTESSTAEQFVNNAGAYQPVTTHSTSSRNILSEILGRLL